MTTPNQPPSPEWYRKQRPLPAHIGPTQRELIARRVRSMQRFLIGTSLVGVATFATLAAWHTESNANTSVQTATTQVEQPVTPATTQVVQPSPTAASQPLFADEESSGFTAESETGDDDSSAVAVTTQATSTTAPTTNTSSQTVSVNSQSTASQTTAAPTSSGRHTKTGSS